MNHGTPIWQGLPVLVVVLAGGFYYKPHLVRDSECSRNRTGYQYFESRLRGPVPARENELIIESVTDAPGEEEIATAITSSSAPLTHAPMLANYLFSALAGTTWYMQFFFYSMGETQMGRYKIFQLDAPHGEYHHLSAPCGASL